MTAIINGTGLSYVAASPATGARDLSIATMQKFADEFAGSKASIGWQKLPSGLLIQWGVITVPTANVGASVSYPVAFTGAALVGMCSITGGNPSGYTCGLRLDSLSSMSVFCTNAYTVQWMVLGY